MSRNQILTADELDALQMTALGERRVATYNFRRPDRISRDQIHSLHYLHDRFARNAATSMSAYLRSVFEMSVTSVDQRPYGELVAAMEDPTAFYALSFEPFPELGAFEIPPAVAFAMIDRMLGGTGTGQAPVRALTEIEQHVVDSVVRVLLDGLTDTWKPLVDLTFGVRARDTRPQLLKVASPNDVMIVMTFDIKLGDVRGTIRLGLPEGVVEATSAQVAQAWQRHRRALSTEEGIWLSRGLMQLPLSVVAEIPTEFPASEVAEMMVGDVIALSVPADRALELRIGGVTKMYGNLVTTRGRVMVRVDRRVDDLPIAEVAA